MGHLTQDITRAHNADQKRQTEGQALPDALLSLEAILVHYCFQKHHRGAQRPVQDEGVVSFTLDHTQGVFIVAIVGWFTSFSIFIIEYFFLPKIRE